MQGNHFLDQQNYLLSTKNYVLKDLYKLEHHLDLAFYTEKSLADLTLFIEISIEI